jgi:hypothetical protein
MDLQHRQNMSRKNIALPLTERAVEEVSGI